MREEPRHPASSCGVGLYLQLINHPRHAGVRIDDLLLGEIRLAREIADHSVPTMICVTLRTPATGQHVWLLVTCRS